MNSSMTYTSLKLFWNRTTSITAVPYPFVLAKIAKVEGVIKQIGFRISKRLHIIITTKCDETGQN